MKKIELTQEQIKDVQEKYRLNVKVEDLCKQTIRYSQFYSESYS